MSNLKIKIRKPKKSEYDTIVKVVNSELSLYCKIYPSGILKQIGIGTFNKTDLIEGEETRNYLIALNNSKMVGFISWYIKPNKVAWISMLEIMPEYYRKGIGTKLVSILEKKVKKAGAVAIALETQKKAMWAAKFYRTLGYKILAAKQLNKKPFINTLRKLPVKNTLIFGEIFKS